MDEAYTQIRQKAQAKHSEELEIVMFQGIRHLLIKQVVGSNFQSRLFQNCYLEDLLCLWQKDLTLASLKMGVLECLDH